MQNEHQIIKMVYAAKEDLQKASDLIQMYIPFIRSETAKFLSRTCTDQDKVRTGQVRVLLGSTAKMGAGTNVQDRLVALHDL